LHSTTRHAGGPRLSRRIARAQPLQYGPRSRKLPVTPVTPFCPVTLVTPVTPAAPATYRERTCGEDRVVSFSARRKRIAGAAWLGDGYGPHVCAQDAPVAPVGRGRAAPGAHECQQLRASLGARTHWDAGVLSNLAFVFAYTGAMAQGAVAQVAPVAQQETSMPSTTDIVPTKPKIDCRFGTTVFALLIAALLIVALLTSCSVCAHIDDLHCNRHKCVPRGEWVRFVCKPLLGLTK
jgi:hypothetical protein